MSNIYSITVTTISKNKTFIKTIQEWAGYARSHQFEAFERIVNQEKKLNPGKVLPRHDSTCINGTNGSITIVTLHHAEVED